MATEANKALVLELYRAMNERDYPGMWALFSPDAIWGGGRFSTAEAGSIERMKPLMVDPMPAFADGGINFTVHALTAEGDRVCLEAKSTASATNGKKYNNDYHFLMYFTPEGKIKQVKEYLDTQHAFDVFCT